MFQPRTSCSHELTAPRSMIRNEISALHRSADKATVTEEKPLALRHHPAFLVLEQAPHVETTRHAFSRPAATFVVQAKVNHLNHHSDALPVSTALYLGMFEFAVDACGAPRAFYPSPTYSLLGSFWIRFFDDSPCDLQDARPERRF